MRRKYPEVDDAVRFLSYAILENLSDMISKNTLLGLCQECPELYSFCFHRGLLPLVFDTDPGSTIKALDAFRSRPQQVDLMELDEDRNVVMKPDSQPVLTCLYRNRSLLFLASEWPDLTLIMKRSGSKKKVRYIYKPPERRKNGKVSARKKSQWRSPRHTERVIVHESEPAVFFDPEQRRKD